jgi:hypothetical protein
MIEAENKRSLTDTEDYNFLYEDVRRHHEFPFSCKAALLNHKKPALG